MEEHSIFIVHPKNWHLLPEKKFSCIFVTNEEAAIKLKKSDSVENQLATIKVKSQPSTGYIEPIQSICSKQEWYRSKNEIAVSSNHRQMYYTLVVTKDHFCELLYPEQYEKARQKVTQEILMEMTVH